MPVIVREADYAHWLAPTADPEALLAPVDADALQITRA
jgi:putative SOS response-associated peptidase YedK